LERGDVLVLFTDGISEAMNAAEDEWEEQGLMESVRKCAELPAARMLARIMQDADSFAAGEPQHDDMTLMVVKLV
jgi:sigma-B regulation protein RsbU (phosphoserine phosphatase)